MVILAHSEIDVLKKLKILEKYILLNNLTVNTKKTKIMSFSRGGFQKNNFPFIFNSELIEVANKYVYLGVTFSSSGLFHDMALSSVDKAKQGIGAIIPIMSKAKIDTWPPRIKIFESLALSLMSNCSPVWSLRYQDLLERVQVSFLKRILLVPRNTPDSAIRLETGRVKYAFNIFKMTLNWLLKILNMSDERYPKLCFKQQLLLIGSSDKKYNWVAQVKEIFTSINHLDLWNNLNARTLKLNTKKLLSDYYNRLYNLDVSFSERCHFLSFYTSFPTGKNPKSYLLLKLPIHITRTLAQLRLSNKYQLKFTVNNILYTIDPKSICTVCNKAENETLLHILFECPIYNVMKPKIQSLENINALIATLENLTINDAKYIYSYICNILKLRSFILNE